MTRLIFVMAALMCAHLSECYHILVMFPYPGKSHSILGYGYVDTLLEAGHEVTFVTPFPRKNDNPKLHIIDNTVTLPLKPENSYNLEMVLNKTITLHNSTRFIELIEESNLLTFNNVHVQEMLNDDRIKFDAVMVEWMLSEYMNSFAEYYQVPLILCHSTEPHGLALKLIDEGTNPAYIPTIVSNGKGVRTFAERTKELYMTIVIDLFKEFYLSPGESKFYEESMAKLIAKKGRVPPPFSVVRTNVSLMLGNSHVSLGSALRLPQSYKPVGGYHIKTDVPPLPKDLQKILDSAAHGVIYFSLGSNVKSKFMPNSMKSDLLKMFGSLKQTVIWKFEDDLPNLPKNVHILQWAPQPSILAHPKTILFITHGGLLSTTETIHFGKPTIAIPVYGDQFSNVERAIRKGFALKVDISYNLAADLKVAIDDFLSNPKYSQKAKELSLVYHDRLVPPGKEVVHWVEHVIKTRGAPHLRSPALDVPWYQKMYLDLAAVVLAIIVIAKKLITSLCCRKKLDLNKKRN